MPDSQVEPPKVVFDCNLFVQAVGKGGNHAWKCLELAIDGDVQIYVSEQILSEIQEVLFRPVLRRRFSALTDERIWDLLDWLREFAIVVHPVDHVFDYPVDPKDEPYIDLAITLKGVYLISWDKHLKRLADPRNQDGRTFIDSYPSIRILDPAEFLSVYYFE